MLLHQRELLKIFLFAAVLIVIGIFIGSINTVQRSVEDEHHFLIECPNRIVRATMFLYLFFCFVCILLI